jgi:hypothetical protein
MRARLRVVPALAMFLTVAAAPVTASASNPGNEHLPNLRAQKPLQLRLAHVDGRRLLRFTTVIVNAGRGPLELRPEHDPGTGTTRAYQQVFTHERGSLEWNVHHEFEVGEFVFHPEHDHWHMEAFAEYRLHAVARDGSLGKRIVRAQKVSFCARDNYQVNAALPHAPGAAGYPGACTQDTPQGISVGWADVYPWFLPDQWVDVTGLGRGKFWLVAEADPLSTLRESNDGDNARAVKIRIRRDQVKVLDAMRIPT